MISLYQRRILALEKQFLEARRSIFRLLRQVRFNPGSVSSSAVKSQLDLVKALITLTKEESAFYVKLGQLYDIMRFHNDFMELLERRYPDLVETMLEEIDKMWIKEEHEEQEEM